MFLSCFGSFMSKIAKKCGLEKKKSHFVSQSSLMCDFDKMTEFKNYGFLGYFILGFFKVSKNQEFGLKLWKN